MVASVPPAAHAPHQAGRRGSSIEAVERRRANRRIANAIRAGRHLPPPVVRLAEHRDRDRQAAARLVRRYFPDGVPAMICITYEYWQARACGWDVLSPVLRWTGRRDGARKKIMHAPDECDTWLWWTSLHYETRAFVRRCCPRRSYDCRQDAQH